MTGWIERARERLRGTGARVTGARVQVLAALMRSDEALSHAELQRRLGDGVPLDRVTLYRVLDWLVEAGLAHRVSGPDRLWRFSAHGAATGPSGHDEHGHFKCVCCDRMFCMKGSPGLARTVRAMLPDGFSGDEIELTVLGRCAQCGADVARAPATR